MQQSSYFVSSFDCTIELIVVGSGAFHRALQDDAFWHEFVPGFTHRKVAGPQMTWLINEDESLGYDLANRTIHANTKTTKKVVIIIEAAFEYLRQQHSLYTMHGSVIVHKDKAVALIGNLSGIGKTTLASYASSRGWRWASDEKFTLSGANIIGGTSGILDDEKTRASASGASPSSPNQPHPLALICQPLVTGETSVTKFVMSPEKTLWTLYDEVTRDIRQVDGIIDTSLPALQSFDDDEITKNRMDAVHALTHRIPVVYLRGPEPLLLAEIEANLQR